MKRIISLILAVTLLITILPTGFSVNAVTPIRVTVDGFMVHFSDVQPTIVDDRTLVPIRGLFEHLGFTVYWNESAETAMLTRPGQVISVRIGDPFFMVNGVQRFPDVPPQLINDRFMLPLRAIAEATETEVNWDELTRTVLVSTQVRPHPRSAILLPNRRLTDSERAAWIAEYYATGGPAVYERELIRLINEVRVDHGLHTVELNYTLSKAARIHAQFLADHNWTNTDIPMHNANPYGGSFQLAETFGFLGTGWANGSPGHEISAQERINAWMASSIHRDNLLSPHANYVGFGLAIGGSLNGNGYLIMSSARPAPRYSRLHNFYPAPLHVQTPAPASMNAEMPSDNPRYLPFAYTTSLIVIPNRRLTDAERAAWSSEYNAMGGASAFEMEVVRLVNETRANHNLAALTIDSNLMMAARFYSQTMSNLDTTLGHNHGPYGGSGGTAEAFGASWNASNGYWGRWTPQEIVTGWMNSPGHRANLLGANLRFIGFGSQLGGQWGVFHYALMSNNPSRHGHQIAPTPSPAGNQPQGQTSEDVTLTVSANPPTGTTILPRQRLNFTATLSNTSNSPISVVLHSNFDTHHVVLLPPRETRVVVLEYSVALDAIRGSTRNFRVYASYQGQNVIMSNPAGYSFSYTVQTS